MILLYENFPKMQQPDDFPNVKNMYGEIEICRKSPKNVVNRPNQAFILDMSLYRLL